METAIRTRRTKAPHCHGEMTRTQVNGFAYYECDQCGDALDERLVTDCAICGYNAAMPSKTVCAKCATLITRR